MRTTAAMAMLSTLLAGLFGCGDDAPATDAGPPDGPIVDADTTTPDALNLCPGKKTFTGAWVDWDSTDATFKGIAGATVVEVGNTSNTASTAPNGRVVLCVTANTDTSVDFTHELYLPMRYSVDGDGPAIPFNVGGLTTARAASLFADELAPSAGQALTYDPAKVQLVVEIRTPAGDPVIGATLTTDAANDGAFTPGADGKYVVGSTTTHDGYVLLANVPTTNAITIQVDKAGSCATRNMPDIPAVNPAGVVAVFATCAP